MKIFSDFIRNKIVKLNFFNKTYTFNSLLTNFDNFYNILLLLLSTPNSIYPY